MPHRLKWQLCDVAQGIMVVGIIDRIVLLQLNVKIPERETTSITHTLFSSRWCMYMYIATHPNLLCVRAAIGIIRDL